MGKYVIKKIEKKTLYKSTNIMYNLSINSVTRTKHNNNSSHMTTRRCINLSYTRHGIKLELISFPFSLEANLK